MSNDDEVYRRAREALEPTLAKFRLLPIENRLLMMKVIADDIVERGEGDDDIQVAALTCAAAVREYFVTKYGKGDK